VLASTKHSKDKFNNCTFSVQLHFTSTIFNTNLLHSVYLFFPHLSASVFGHLHGVFVLLMCAVFGNSLHI
jgi:hypothetical protein